jgi:hypothetical protein
MICIAKMKSRGEYFAQLLPYKDDYMHALICGSGALCGQVDHCSPQWG